MSKRWTLEEDIILAKYYPGVGDHVGVHDLKRPEGAADKRVRELKETGAWSALRRMLSDEFRNLHAYYLALGDQRAADFLVDMHPGAPERVPDVHHPKSAPHLKLIGGYDD